MAGRMQISDRDSIPPTILTFPGDGPGSKRGITTSGFLSEEEALRLLTVGPLYYQTVIKTERAAARLRRTSSTILSAAEIRAYREDVSREEEECQTMIADILSEQ